MKRKFKGLERMNQNIISWVQKVWHPVKNWHQLQPDLSSRRYYRIFNDQGETIILCIKSPFKNECEKFIKTTRLLNQHGILTPKVMATNESLGVILQEDLGDALIQNYLGHADPFYVGPWVIKDRNLTHTVDRMLIEELLKRWFKIPTCGDLLVFNRSKWLFEFGWTWRFGVGDKTWQRLKVKSEILFNQYFEIAELLSQGPLVVVHRDLHSRNVFFQKNNLIFIDYQDLRVGNVYYDIVSWVVDAYLAYDPSRENHIVQEFKKNLKNFDEELYLLQKFQRLWKMWGTFSYFVKNGKQHYKKSLNQTIDLLINLIDGYPRLKTIDLSVFRWVFDDKF